MILQKMFLPLMLTFPFAVVFEFSLHGSIGTLICPFVLASIKVMRGLTELLALSH